MMKTAKIVFVFIIVSILLSFFISYKSEIIQRFKLLDSTDTLIFENQYINIVKVNFKNHSFLKGSLRSARKLLTIYLHHKSDHISQQIINHGTWEVHLLSQFENYINANPGIQVFDAGSNIGVYSLTAEALGCRVVSVDANVNNTDRLVQSFVANNLTNNVTVVLNAIGNNRNEFILSREENNVGGQFVIPNHNDSRRVRGIIMDDLLPLFMKEKPIVMKMDIQGKEIESFQNATRFFDERNVTLLMIEWIWIKNMTNIDGLMNFLTNRKYEPYAEYKKITRLNLTNYQSWPYDFMWIKRL